MKALGGMGTTLSKPRGWGAERCRYIGETYLDWFVAYAAAEIRRSGQAVGAEELKELAERFRETATTARLLFHDSFFSCNQARINNKLKDFGQDYLVRLLVEQILPLFVEEGGPPFTRGGLSTKMLPGLFRAIKSAVGAEQLEKRQNHCMAIVERLRCQVGGDFEWDDFVRDGETRQILVRTLADLAHRFDDFETAKEGFIHTVNKSQFGDQAGAGQDKSEGRFDPGQFATFARYFFVPLAEAVLETKEGRPVVDGIHGDELDLIKRFLTRIA